MTPLFWQFSLLRLIRRLQLTIGIQHPDLKRCFTIDYKGPDLQRCLTSMGNPIEIRSQDCFISTMEFPLLIRNSTLTQPQDHTKCEEDSREDYRISAHWLFKLFTKHWGLGRHFQKHSLIRKKIIFWLNFHWSDVCSQGSNSSWVNMAQTISKVLHWMKVFISLINFIEQCSWVSNWWYFSIGSGHSLVPLGDRPFIAWTNADRSIQCHELSSQGHSEITSSNSLGLGFFCQSQARVLSFILNYKHVLDSVCGHQN